MFGMSTAFDETALLLALATLIGMSGLLLRQPLIVSFIAAGIIAGPGALGLVSDPEVVDLLAEIGIALLLFLVGLKLDLKLVRTLGPVATATGLGQVIFTAGVGFLLTLVMGFDVITSIYVAVALTFSSTIIIVKLLSDKREIDSLHGRIALGFLIVQDIVVVLAMIVLSTLGIGGEGEVSAIVRTAVGGVALLMFVGGFIRYIADPLMRWLSKAPEMLVTFAIAWAVLLAAVSDTIGFGKELGGLLAGVALASTPLREAVASRLSSLRDFLLLFFFLSLGAKLDLGVLGAQVPAAVVLSLFVLIGNPLIVLVIMGYMGYRKRTGFLAGLTVAQISEFSLIFMGMGLALGHVNESAMGLVTLVGLVTITLSTYMILYSHPIYARLEPLLRPFERRLPSREQADDEPVPEDRHKVIIFGLGRFGGEIASALESRDIHPLGVDFDPEALQRWTASGRAGVYGDASDPEFLPSLPLAGADWVVVAVPPYPQSLDRADIRLSVLHGLRQAGYQGRLAFSSHNRVDAETMAATGVDLVLLPYHDGAIRAVERMVDGQLGAAAGAAIDK
jgi:Kef-type K+ transport system membrane component KefB